MTDKLRHFAAVALLLIGILLLVACGDDDDSTTSASPATTGASPETVVWGLPGADLANSRFVGGPIDSSTVDQLGLAWTVPIKASGSFGAYATTPVVSNGVIYTQDMVSDVRAINLETGKVLWTKKYNSPSIGPNGVTTDGDTVYGATGDSAFALQAATGQQLWIKKLPRNANEGIDMAPGLHNGVVYVSTVPGNATSFYKGNGQSILFALDARTGATKWTWAQVPANLWSKKHKDINSGGGLWDPPSFDGNGNLYIAVSNPAPFPGAPKLPWGASRAGPNLYTNSLVKLDEETGKLIWYYQLTPHDIYDWDLQNSPVFGTANGKRVVIDAGKAGIVFAVDAASGKLLWKTPVGVHNGHDDDNLAAMKGDYSKLKLPFKVFPGDLGGVESQIATNGSTVVVATNNLPATQTGQGNRFVKLADPKTGTGDLVAIDVSTGEIKWDAKLKSSPYGAATIANDVVFTTTYDGTVQGYDMDTGTKVWSTKLPAGTNTPVAVTGDTLLTAASLPAPGQTALITAFRLGGTASFPRPKSTPTSTTPAPTSPEQSASSSVALAAKGNELAYDSTTETAKAGKVTIKFTNASSLPHNVVLETAGGKTIGKTPTFSGGGTKDFRTRLKPGTYAYFCSVPGHRQAGMEGTLTVK
jgi:outer membrane protein assembly factor BamB